MASARPTAKRRRSVDALAASDLVGPLARFARRWPASPIAALAPRSGHARFARVTRVRATTAHWLARSDITDRRALGGFAGSTNPSRALRGADRVLRRLVAHQKSLQLVADVRGKTLRLLLVNNSGHTVAFDALDSALPIVQQARDAHGRWRDLQTMARSFCGNSLHRLYLRDGRFWRFDAERFAGSRRALLRFELRAGRLRLASNSYRGRVDPRQYNALAAQSSSAAK
ncbi:MAG: hypothetical protein KC503_24065 [Myxococcales bacterium]|nr:hypothetical protein [Myxococcales bacterium]